MSETFETQEPTRPQRKLNSVTRREGDPRYDQAREPKHRQQMSAQHKPHVMDGLRLAAYGNCVINNWVGAPAKEQMAAFESYLNTVSKTCQDGIVFFVVLEPGAPILTAEQRKEMEALYARWGPSLRATAQVVE